MCHETLVSTLSVAPSGSQVGFFENADRLNGAAAAAMACFSGNQPLQLVDVVQPSQCIHSLHKGWRGSNRARNEQQSR